MHLDDTFHSKPSEKAELFNNYFYEQFSGPSNYKTDINFSNDQVFDIDFNRNRVHKHLSNINSNKAMVYMVKFNFFFRKALHLYTRYPIVARRACRVRRTSKGILHTSIAYPLSLLLKVSDLTHYNTGSLPKEWKLANAVSVHKKGSKDDIKNYRPISLTCLVMKLFERILKEELLLRT